MTKKPNGAITWLQINNLIPVITSAIIITLSWASLSVQIELLNQKVDSLISNQKQLVQSRKDLENRYGELSLKVKGLETTIYRK